MCKLLRLDTMFLRGAHLAGSWGTSETQVQTTRFNQKFHLTQGLFSAGENLVRIRRSKSK